MQGDITRAGELLTDTSAAMARDLEFQSDYVGFCPGLSHLLLVAGSDFTGESWGGGLEWFKFEDGELTPLSVFASSTGISGCDPPSLLRALP